MSLNVEVALDQFLCDLVEPLDFCSEDVLIRYTSVCVIVVLWRWWSSGAAVPRVCGIGAGHVQHHAGAERGGGRCSDVVPLGECEGGRDVERLQEVMCQIGHCGGVLVHIISELYNSWVSFAPSVFHLLIPDSFVLLTAATYKNWSCNRTTVYDLFLFQTSDVGIASVYLVSYYRPLRLICAIIWYTQHKSCHQQPLQVVLQKLHVVVLVVTAL